MDNQITYLPRFWVVFRDDNRLAATVRHGTREAAIKEAIWFAKGFPGKRFFVATITGYAEVPNTEYTPFYEMSRVRS